MSGQSYLPRRRDKTVDVLHHEDAEWAQAMPALYQLMCHARTPKGDYRDGARVSLFCEQGRIKASVWDPTTEMVYFVTLGAWDSVLLDLERALTNGSGEWREKRENGYKR